MWFTANSRTNQGEAKNIRHRKLLQGRKIIFLQNILKLSILKTLTILIILNSTLKTILIKPMNNSVSKFLSYRNF